MGAREVFFLPIAEGNFVVEVTNSVVRENGGVKAMARRLRQSDQATGRFLIERPTHVRSTTHTYFRFSDEYTAFIFKMWYG